ncbi:ATP-dependent zinc metalloprotease FtsH [Paraburkholderia aspalathi]|uniref:AAA family ATPase n=1 Tax=Paraburkholderia aspalathi TaxID=1324617 RepID=UPI001B095339|nr:AAA family ATPase [Paraburkholderia aspalathi]CAE6753615.1 ATP-dependent zinc metalloprotease FtsH [Paraburkholderia aspalathi]
MKHLVRSVSGYVLHFVLATVLYGWACAILHELTPGKLTPARNWPLLLCIAVALVAVFWFLYRRYHFVRRVVLFVLGLATLQSLVHLDRPWLTALAGCVVFAVAAGVWYRWAHPLSPSTRRANVPDARRDSYFQAVFPGAAPSMRPSQPAVSASVPDPVRAAEPAYSFDELVAQPRFDFSQILGMAETKARLLGAAREVIENPERARNGILLFGDAGNGKTMFAEALAGELGVAFFALDYGSVASKWINETPAKVKAAFAQALKLGHGVFFIDEFDSYVKPRGEGTHPMDRDLTNVMLTEIVRLRGTRIVLVAATNNVAALDSAAIREGRFDFKVEAPPPDLEARKAILRRAVGEAMGFHALTAPMLANLAARWEGFSAARLTSIGRELADMRREGAIGEGSLSFDVAMLAMRRLQGSKGRLPENVKSIDEIIMPDASRNDLLDLAFRLRHAYGLERLGGSLPRGVLFYGPPGTGKTQAALALAKASGFAFLKTTGADLLANPCAWDRLVRDAKDLRPAIVFIDEADDVLGERRMSGVSPVTNKVLTTLDGADGRLPDVLYICATNHQDALDLAVLRGGRLEEKVEFSVPEHDALASYVRMRFRVMAGDVFAVSRHTMDCAVAGLKGHSIADADAVLQRTIDAAAVRHLREGTAVITAEDVRTALRSRFALG